MIFTYNGEQLDGELLMFSDKQKAYVDKLEIALSALRAQEKEPCEFCGRGKPIRAHTIMPDTKMQYGFSVYAKFCPMCGRKLEVQDEERN